jgi:hypothetical protein
MNKNICGAGNEQSVGCAKMTEGSSADYQLWNSVTIKKGMVVRNLCKQQNGKNLYQKRNSTARKHFTGELHMWEYLT